MRTTIDLNNEWRRVASAIYKRPTDSKILGQSEVDVTDLEKYISAKRQQGIKTTMTQILTLAAARAMRFDIPELNVYIRRGKVIPRPHIDAMVSVLLEGSEMGSVKIHNADQITLEEMSVIMVEEIKKARSGNENKIMDMKGKTLFNIGLNGLNASGFYVSSDNTRYASYSYGTLTFNDKSTLAEIFNPHWLKTEGKVYLAYMYYSPKKNAIMQCKILF